MYAPDQSKYVYPKKGAKNIANSSTIPDIENPDFEKFPLFKKANPIRFVLKAGEMLFVANGWWHTTKMHTPSNGRPDDLRPGRRRRDAGPQLRPEVRA